MMISFAIWKWAKSQYQKIPLKKMGDISKYYKFNTKYGENQSL